MSLNTIPIVISNRIYLFICRSPLSYKTPFSTSTQNNICRYCWITEQNQKKSCRNVKNKSLYESNILGNENFQALFKNAPFKGCSTLVAMVTTAASSRPGALFSYKNVAKKE